MTAAAGMPSRSARATTRMCSTAVSETVSRGDKWWPRAFFGAVPWASRRWRTCCGRSWGTFLRLSNRQPWAPRSVSARSNELAGNCGPHGDDPSEMLIPIAAKAATAAAIRPARHAGEHPRCTQTSPRPARATEPDGQQESFARSPPPQTSASIVGIRRDLVLLNHSTMQRSKACFSACCRDIP